MNETINETKAMTYNDKHYAVMANDIVKGKQEMTLWEARIIRLLITQAVKEDKDLKTYIREINEKSDIEIEYNYTKQGRKIDSLHFTVWYNMKKAL